MYYQENIGIETTEREYKKFNFNFIGLPIKPSIAENLVKTSEFVFNKYIKKSIRKYLKIYLPKYISAFMDDNSTIENGELYFGISDDGIVEGIPYQGELKIKKLNNFINDIITNKIICTNKSEIIKNISVELIKVSYENTDIPIENPFYTKYTISHNIFLENEKNFMEKYKEWLDKMFNHTQKKLVELFNNEPSRTKIYNYIKNKDSLSNVLDLIDKGFQLEQKNHEEIATLKDDKTDPYYWVCEWKDGIIDELRPIKPVPSHRLDSYFFYNPQNIIINLSPMIPWWMQNNDNMNLYVLKISFKKLNETISYIDKNNINKRCYRTCINNNPCCMPID
jgi:hypothetical protein